MPNTVKLNDINAASCSYYPFHLAPATDPSQPPTGWLARTYSVQIIGEWLCNPFLGGYSTN